MMDLEALKKKWAPRRYIVGPTGADRDFVCEAVDDVLALIIELEAAKAEIKQLIDYNNLLEHYEIRYREERAKVQAFKMANNEAPDA